MRRDELRADCDFVHWPGLTLASAACKQRWQCVTGVTGPPETKSPDVADKKMIKCSNVQAFWFKHNPCLLCNTEGKPDQSAVFLTSEIKTKFLHEKQKIVPHVKLETNSADGWIAAASIYLLCFLVSRRFEHWIEMLERRNSFLTDCLTWIESCRLTLCCRTNRLSRSYWDDWTRLCCCRLYLWVL